MTRLFLIITLPWLAIAASANDSIQIETQRALFRTALPEAEKGRWILNADQQAIMTSYVLYPDLRGTWLVAKAADLSEATIEQFVLAYPDLRVTNRLLQKRARVLAAAGRWQELGILVRDFAHFDLIAGNTKLQCQIIQMQLDTADASRAGLVEEALNLWLVGRSQPKECDPVFAWLDAQGALTQERIQERIALAITQRQFRLAAWLARFSGPEKQQWVEAWQRMARDPLRELDSAAGDGTLIDRDRLIYGMALAGHLDLDGAISAWQAGYREIAPDENTTLEIEQSLALSAARKGHPDAMALLASLDPSVSDDLVVAWRLRLALRNRDWVAFEDAFPALSTAEQERDLWVYWRARAGLETGNREEAMESLQLLSADRSYHGFLAADLLGRPYRFENQPVIADDALLARIAGDPRMIRARELFVVGQYSAARSEWNDFVSGHDERLLSQASLLAHRWGWHSSAISAAAKSGQFDALDIRFPQPWPEEFARHAGQAGIPLSWAYGIARSESLYMSDVRSPAGAIGLMQLMPATGREMGQRLGRQVTGWQSLVDPETNIALGTGYLGEMLARFDNNPVLATAAYNAGPRRVATWLPENDLLAAEIWVDTIPFRETRRYLRRVLSSQVVFSWQLDEDMRLSALMPPVAPVIPAERVAQQQP